MWRCVFPITTLYLISSLWRRLPWHYCYNLIPLIRIYWICSIISKISFLHRVVVGKSWNRSSFTRPTPTRLLDRDILYSCDHHLPDRSWHFSSHHSYPTSHRAVAFGDRSSRSVNQ